MIHYNEDEMVRLIEDITCLYQKYSYHIVAQIIVNEIINNVYVSDDDNFKYSLRED